MITRRRSAGDIGARREDAAKSGAQVGAALDLEPTTDGREPVTQPGHAGFAVLVYREAATGVADGDDEIAADLVELDGRMDVAGMLQRVCEAFEYEQVSRLLEAAGVSGTVHVG